jgi:hypothetical protein
MRPSALPPAPSSDSSDGEDALQAAAAELDALITERTPQQESCVGLSDLELAPERPRTYREPIAVWGQYARHARAILVLAAGLHRDEIGTLEQWRVALGVSTNEELPWGWASEAERRREARVYSATDWHFQWLKLLGVIDDWLRGADIRVTGTLRYERDSKDRWVVSPFPAFHTPWGLFGDLGLQLLFAACRATGWVMCANAGAGARGCEEIYFPRRQPRRQGPLWCPACRGRGYSQEWYRNRGKKQRAVERRKQRRAK